MGEFDNMTVKEALPLFYSNYQLPSDGGITAPVVRIKLMKGISLFMPNFKARKKVVPKHDVHHLLTGYAAEMKGEAEISSWELSTGCLHHWFAFMINTLGMMTGLLINPVAVWKAWHRGKHSSNLYKSPHTEAQILQSDVAELRKELRLHQNDRSGMMFSVSTFCGFLIFGLFFSFLSLALVPVILIYSLYITLFN